MLSAKLEIKTKYFRRNAEGNMLTPKLGCKRKQLGKSLPPWPGVTDKKWSGQNGERACPTEGTMGTKHESESRDQKEESIGHISKVSIVYLRIGEFIHKKV